MTSSDARDQSYLMSDSIALENLLNDGLDPKSLELLRQDGFIFLDLENSNVWSIAQPLLQQAQVYLHDTARNQGSTEGIHGHISSGFKDSLRLVTGNQFTLIQQSISNDLDLTELVKIMDETVKSIANVLAEPLFGAKSVSDMAERYDLPLLQPMSEARNNATYGLLDIVCYHNDKDSFQLTPEIMVAEHADPGLFILALPESVPGLELRNATGEWVMPPPGKGILWMGKAAAHKVQPCIHRVRRHPENPRLACWHEVCTSSQISTPLLQYLEQTQQELALPGGTITGTDKVLEHLRKAENHGRSIIAQEKSFLKKPSTDSHRGIMIAPPPVDDSHVNDPLLSGGIPMSKIDTDFLSFFPSEKTDDDTKD